MRATHVVPTLILLAGLVACGDAPDQPADAEGDHRPDFSTDHHEERAPEMAVGHAGGQRDGGTRDGAHDDSGRHHPDEHQWPVPAGLSDQPMEFSLVQHHGKDARLGEHDVSDEEQEQKDGAEDHAPAHQGKIEGTMLAELAHSIT